MSYDTAGATGAWSWLEQASRSADPERRVLRGQHALSTLTVAPEDCPHQPKPAEPKPGGDVTSSGSCLPVPNSTMTYRPKAYCIVSEMHLHACNVQTLCTEAAEWCLLYVILLALPAEVADSAA